MDVFFVSYPSEIVTMIIRAIKIDMIYLGTIEISINPSVCDIQMNRNSASKTWISIRIDVYCCLLIETLRIVCASV